MLQVVLPCKPRTRNVPTVLWSAAINVEAPSIELVFTFIATVAFFREKVSRLEVLGIVMVVGAILLLLLAG